MDFHCSSHCLDPIPTVCGVFWWLGYAAMAAGCLTSVWVTLAGGHDGTRPWRDLVPSPAALQTSWRRV